MVSVSLSRMALIGLIVKDIRYNEKLLYITDYRTLIINKKELYKNKQGPSDK